MNIAVVIPAYNEARHLPQLLDQIPGHIGEHVLRTIVVDDGSRDETAQLVEELGYTLIRHQTNLGKGAAAKTGCDAAYILKADIIVLMDGDGQHQPQEIASVIAPLVEGANHLVVGARTIGAEMPMTMRFGNRALNGIIKGLFSIRVTDSQSGFRAFPRELYPTLRWASAHYAMESEMLILAAKHKIPLTEVPITTTYLDNYKGTTPLDGLRILNTLLKWKFLWFREYSLLEQFSA